MKIVTTYAVPGTDLSTLEIEFGRDENPKDFGYAEFFFNIPRLSSYCVPHDKMDDYRDYCAQFGTTVTYRCEGD